MAIEDIEDIEQVTVLGAGSMGHGIAELAALAGYDVRLRDIERDLVEEGVENIEWSLSKLVGNDRLDQATADAARDRIEGVVDLEAAVAGTDFVVEAVPERMDVKTDVYAELSEAAPDRAVFATNTSSLSITDLAGATDRPEQFCGMHFFNPPVQMDLVEVIAGDRTAEATLELTEALAEEMDKTPIRVRTDSPGFIVNRVLVPPMNEAAWMVHDGEATVREVDSTAKLELGMPMGVFALADQVGLDVVLDVLDHLAETLGGAYEPCPMISEAVESGRLGKKSGEGVYDYGDDGGPEFAADAVREDVATRLEAVMANEAAALVGADVAPVADVDRALQLGAGFPEGPAALADERGLDVLYGVLVERHEETGHPRYEPADELQRLVEAGETFHGSGTDGDRSPAAYDTVRVERHDDGVAELVIDREHRLNAVTPAVARELTDAAGDLDRDDDVRTILLRGAGDRAFSTGADAESFLGDLGHVRGVEISRQGHEMTAALETAGVPVVAAIDGYCLGGGMEIAAAADFRVASRRSTFGQPEHGLGIMPGWGGTQRLPRIVGEGRAKEIIFLDERYDAETMVDYGFVTRLTADDAFREEARAFARDLARGPPLAQDATKLVMRAGRDDLEAGLEAEAQAFGHLLDTDDMVEGVTAFMADREPEFEGT